MADRPSIILIMTDTQGANVVGCYGRPEVQTPCIDRLAAEGIRFDRAYTCQPVCGPARSALFTGNWPHTNGVIANNIPLGANIKTVGERMQDNGYHTAYIGKWHVDGTDYFGNGRCPAGWDPAYWYDGRNYLEELTDEERLRWRKELNRAENIHKYGVSAEFTWAHRCSDRGIDFLEKHAAADKPFLLVVSYDEPHDPFTCPPPWCDMFTDFEYDTGPATSDSLEGKPAHQKEWAAAAGYKPGAHAKLKNPMYFGCNSFVDDEIGRVLAAAESHAPDALVIYTSDHGTPLWAHGLTSKGPAMYDDAARVPFIVKWQGQTPAGAVTADPVSHIDVVPSILDAAGIEVPPFLEGRSMLATFRDPSVRPNEQIFMEFNRYEVNHDSWGGFQPIRCVFDGRYKLVINLHTSDELYDLELDPYEMRNLIDDDGTAAIRDRLHDRILAWLDTTRDPMRGPVWERRPWRKERKQTWQGSGMTRPRKDDGYEPRMNLYSTGLAVEKWEYRK